MEMGSDSGPVRPVRLLYEACLGMLLLSLAVLGGSREQQLRLKHVNYIYEYSALAL